MTFTGKISSAQGAWSQLIIVLMSLMMMVFFFNHLSAYRNGLFFEDSWHLVDVSSGDTSLWEGFTYQHGPHRMGVAFLLYRAMAATHLEYAFIHAFFQGIGWVLSGALALFIVWRERGHFIWADALIPVVFLHPGLLPSTIMLPYIHGFTVLFTLTLISLMYVRSEVWRTGLTLWILFWSAFTFNAILIVPVFFLFSVVRWWQTRKREWAIYILGLMVLGIVFVMTNQPKQFGATLESSFEFGLALEYLVELSSAFFFYQADNFHPWVALFLIILMVLLFFLPVRIRQKEQTISVRWILIGVIGAFWLLNTYTRWSSGPANAHSFRYYSMIPLVLFALYWSAMNLRKWRQPAIVVVVLLSLYSVRTGLGSRYLLTDYDRRMEEFMRCYPIERESCPGLLYLHPNPGRVHLLHHLQRLGYSNPEMYSFQTTSATTKVLPPTKMRSFPEADSLAARRAASTLGYVLPRSPALSASAHSSSAGSPLGMSGLQK